LGTAVARVACSLILGSMPAHRGQELFRREVNVVLMTKRIRKEENGRIQNKGRSLARRPLWIIISYQSNRMNVLTLDPDSDGGFLAVFSFKEEAEAFLSLLEDDHKRDWRSRQTAAGELVSILMGPCASVKRVALDPLPVLFSRAMLGLVSVNRKRFVQDLLEEHKGLPGELVPAYLRSA
jgi:hypothetical protein